MVDILKQAWNDPFYGFANQSLLNIIARSYDQNNNNNNNNDNRLYSNILFVAQYPGTGKSRLLNEISNEILVLPLRIGSINQGC